LHAYRWALANAPIFKGDSAKVAVAGESAGGNMAVGVGIMARDSGVKAPVSVLSIYPVADKNSTTASKLKYVDAKPLGTPALPWFLMYYLRTPADVANPLISLVDADLHNLPPTTIIGAELDPLQAEGKELADKLQSAGVQTTYKLYNGVTHEFFGMAGVLPEAKDAQQLASGQLRKYFQ
jgi:acetyl esterase